MELEIRDRRGANKVDETPAAVEEVREPAAFGDKLEWKSKGFTLVYLPMNGQTLLSGRAVGLRTDERLFTVDWLLPPVWDEKLRWQEKALERLETFKCCSCRGGAQCRFHVEHCGGKVGPGKWLLEDLKRLEKVQNTVLPECLEILMKAERSRSQARVVPAGR